MSNWPLVPLGKVVKLDLDSVPVDATATYQMVGVYSFGRGLFKKEPVAGSNTSYRQFFRLRAGQFVMSQLFGWEGALAICTPEFDGLFVSPQFPTFATDPTSLMPEFLDWYTQQPAFWSSLGTKAKGMGDRRRTLNPEAFLSSVIPLPPLDEQQAVVSYIKVLAGKFSEVTRLRKESESGLEMLCRSMLFSAAGKESVRMADLVQLRQTDTKVERDQDYAFAGVYCFGKGVFKGQAKNGTQFAYDRLTRIRVGEFTYPKLMAWEGALGIVPIECDGLFVSPEYPVFNVDTERVLPEILDVYYRTPSVWPILADASNGTNVRRRRLHPSAFLKLHMPVPPMSVQREIRRVRQAFESVSAIRRSSEDEVKSLLASTLNEVFQRGLPGGKPASVQLLRHHEGLAEGPLERGFLSARKTGSDL